MPKRKQLTLTVGQRGVAIAGAVLEEECDGEFAGPDADGEGKRRWSKEAWLLALHASYDYVSADRDKADRKRLSYKLSCKQCNGKTITGSDKFNFRRHLQVSAATNLGW